MSGAYGAKGEFNVWPTFTDIVFAVLLLMIFIMLGQYIVIGKILQVNKIKKEQKLFRTSLEEKFKADFGTHIKEVSQPQFQKITFSDRILFDVNSDVLKEEGKEILKKIAEVIKAIRKQVSFDEIQVRGHTDDRPIRGGKFATNWELSSARATSVVRFFVDVCGLASTKDFLISAQGYSQYDHVVDNTDADSRAKNRRIELVIKYPLKF